MSTALSKSYISRNGKKFFYDYETQEVTIEGTGLKISDFIEFAFFVISETASTWLIGKTTIDRAESLLRSFDGTMEISRQRVEEYTKRVQSYEKKVAQIEAVVVSGILSIDKSLKQMSQNQPKPSTEKRGVKPVAKRGGPKKK